MGWDGRDLDEEVLIEDSETPLRHDSAVSGDRMPGYLLGDFVGMVKAGWDERGRFGEG